MKMNKINAEIAVSVIIAEVTVQHRKNNVKNVEKGIILKEYVILKHLTNIYHQLY